LISQLLQQQLEDYEPFDETEAAMVSRLQRFLSQARGENPFARDLIGEAPKVGHVTGSAWVINQSGTSTLVVHHAKLGRWVQPGGHCDGESDVLNVALREAREETGLNVAATSPAIFDVDAHLIPEYWNTPDHWHYDVRFLLQADDKSTPVASAESRAVRWVSLEEAARLNPDASIARMIAKTKQRFR
jgi:8-oxo-dGTP pyrophosphatase MutT (NUDIX family)